MTLEEDIPEEEEGRRKFTSSPISSKGEDEGYASYGSEFHVPDLAEGLIRVNEDCCRASYRKSRALPDNPYLVCLNASTCRAKYGGLHTVLRRTQRAEPGIYEGVFGTNGKLRAAKYSTWLTTMSMKEAEDRVQESDRAQAQGIEDLTGGDEMGGLLSSYFSVSQAKSGTHPDQDVEGVASGFFATNLIGPKNPLGSEAQFLEVISSLVRRIEVLDGRLADSNQANTTTNKPSTNNLSSATSILRPPRSRGYTGTSDRDLISLVAQRQGAQGKQVKDRKKDSKGVSEDGRRRHQQVSSGEESQDGGPDGKPWWINFDEL